MHDCTEFVLELFFNPRKSNALITNWEMPHFPKHLAHNFFKIVAVFGPKYISDTCKFQI